MDGYLHKWLKVLPINNYPIHKHTTKRYLAADDFFESRNSYSDNLLYTDKVHLGLVQFTGFRVS